MGSGVSLDKVQEPVSVEFPSISAKRHSIDSAQRRRAPIEKIPSSRQKTLSEVDFPPPPSELFSFTQTVSQSRQQSASRLQVSSSRTGSNCSINPSLAVPTIGPNFNQTLSFRNRYLSHLKLRNFTFIKFVVIKSIYQSYAENGKSAAKKNVELWKCFVSELATAAANTDTEYKQRKSRTVWVPAALKEGRNAPVDSNHTEN